MPKNQLNDFAETLTAQLKDAAQQMRTMRKPPVHEKKELEEAEPFQNEKAYSVKKIHNHKDASLASQNIYEEDSLQNTEETTLQKVIGEQQIRSSDNLDETSIPKKLIYHKQSQAVTSSHFKSPIATYSHKQSQTAIDSHRKSQIPQTPTSLDNYVIQSSSQLSAYTQENTQISSDSLPKQKINDHIHDTQNNQAKKISPSINTYLDHNSHLQQMTPNNEDTPTKPWGHYNPHALNSVRLSTSAIGGARQLVLDALIQLRNESPQVTINLKRLATVLGLSYGTVRNTISRLVREGVIYTTQIRTGDVHGVYIEFPELPPRLQSLTVTQQTFPPVSTHHENSQNPIWNADIKTLAGLWPNAVAAGLTPTHLDILRKAYILQGFNDTTLAQYLRYINWEIEADPLNGSLVLQQWLQVMQQKGQYPCPMGYTESKPS